MIITADDYGMSPAVSQGIRDLIALGRLQSVSCLLTGPYGAHELEQLQSFSKSSLKIGLHLTLTNDQALSQKQDPMPSFARVFWLSHLRRLDSSKIKQEIVAQISAFHSALGRYPDFIDGHQHVHQLPMIRKALLEAYSDFQLKCPIRAFRFPFLRLLKSPQTLLQAKLPGFILLRLLFENLVLTLQGRPLLKKLRAQGIATNETLLGHFPYRSEIEFGKFFAFYQTMTSSDCHDDWLMCHPGLIDAALKRRDPVWEGRLSCYDFLRDFIPSLGHPIEPKSTLRKRAR